MTLYHNSPRTGKAARCRAKIQCLYGTTHGTTIRRDGTVEVGTGGSTWSSLPNPPAEHGSEERIIVDENGVAKNIWSVENRDLRTNRPTNTTVEKPANRVEITDENNYTLTYEENGSTINIQIVDGYPTQETVELFTELERAQFSNGAYTRSGISFHDPEESDEKSVREHGYLTRRIDELYSIDVFVLQDEETAEGIADELSERITNSDNREIWTVPTASNAKKFLEGKEKGQYVPFGMATRPASPSIWKDAIMNEWHRQRKMN